MIKKYTSALLIITLSACMTVTSLPEFNKNKASMSDAEVCRSYLHAQSNFSDHAMINATLREANDRSLDALECKRLVGSQNTAIAGVATVGAILAVAVASKGSGGGYAASQSKRDFDWEWDEFYNQYRVLVWACRGIQTGQFASETNCQYKVKTDRMWPSKQNF